MTELDAKEVFGWLDDCGELHLKVQGSSMSPFLHDKTDSVFLVKPQKIRRGDIVVFERNGCYIMHRVISVDNGFIDTLGDNLDIPETHIPLGNVAAVAVGAVRKGKKISTRSLIWKFYGRIYIIPAVRKVLRKLRRIIF